MTSFSNPRGEHTETRPPPPNSLARSFAGISMSLESYPLDELLRRRYEKFRNIGQFYTV